VSGPYATCWGFLDDTHADGGPVDLADAVAYYLAIADVLTDTAAAVQRGRAAGAALGEDPMATLSALTGRVLERVRAAPATAVAQALTSRNRRAAPSKVWAAGESIGPASQPPTHAVLGATPVSDP